MRETDLSDLPNPFAVDPVRPGSRRARTLGSAIKVLLVVAVAFIGVVLLGSESRRWLFGRLTEDFDALRAEQKRDRLVQIAEMDELAIPFLVTAMREPEIAVARTAHDLLRRLQSEWTTLARHAMLRRQRTMILALDAEAPQLPDDRTGWASGLAQQLMMETMNAEDERSRELHRLASDTLSRLSLMHRPGPSILETPPENSPPPPRMASRMGPLPVDLLGDAMEGTWVDGAPLQELRPLTDSTLDEASDRGLVGDDGTDQSPQLGSPNRNDPEPVPSIYQSSASPKPTVRMRPVDEAESIEFHQLEDAWETGLREGPIQQASQLVTSPMEMLDDRSVILWLGSDERRRREQAREELTRRGLEDHEIEIAVGVASSDLRIRLEVIDTITRSSGIDPRPWLLMLLDDPSRDVKLRVISALATMSDPGIEGQLRMRLADEPDPTVAARIERVLQLR